MLVLKREVGESIVISDDIQVKVLGYENGQIRLGIQAPTDVSVHRKEVYIRIKSKDSCNLLMAETN